MNNENDGAGLAIGMILGTVVFLVSSFLIIMAIKWIVT